MFRQNPPRSNPNSFCRINDPGTLNATPWIVSISLDVAISFTARASNPYRNMDKYWIHVSAAGIMP
ncbi:hypothetical protein BGZ52_002592, partial [Haplosporangium bisporale]